MHSTFTPSLHLVPLCLLHGAQDVYILLVYFHTCMQKWFYMCVCVFQLPSFGQFDTRHDLTAPKHKMVSIF